MIYFKVVFLFMIRMNIETFHTSIIAPNAIMVMFGIVFDDMHPIKVFLHTGKNLLLLLVLVSLVRYTFNILGMSCDCWLSSNRNNKTFMDDSICSEGMFGPDHS